MEAKLVGWRVSGCMYEIAPAQGKVVKGRAEPSHQMTRVRGTWPSADTLCASAEAAVLSGMMICDG
jgi:hypothetical protein